MEIDIFAPSCARDEFLQPGLFLSDDFKRLVLSHVAKKIPAVRGTLRSLDFAVPMTTLEAMSYATQHVISCNSFARIVLAFIETDRKKKRVANKLLKNDELNIFIVGDGRRVFEVWVDPFYKSDTFSGYGLFAYALKSPLQSDAMCRFEHARIFI